MISFRPDRLKKVDVKVAVSPCSTTIGEETVASEFRVDASTGNSCCPERGISESDTCRSLLLRKRHSAIAHLL